MHTVRNRLASRPPVGTSVASGVKPPNHAAMRHELPTIQRGSMAVPLFIPDESGLIEPRWPKRRNPKGKKARKAAARLAQVLDAVPGEAPAPARKARQAPKKGKAKARRAVTQGGAIIKPVQPEQLPAIPSPPLLEQRLATAPVLLLPHLPEPLVEQRPARLLSLAEMPERAEPEAFILPAAPEPAVALLVPAEPEAVPVPEPEPAAALAEAPLPRARALVPARRQGLIDVIAFLLRDSGRRLARWSARRHKSRTEQAALRRAEARQLNLQRELEALDALRRHRG